jgi:hypothetical protein
MKLPGNPVRLWLAGRAKGLLCAGIEDETRTRWADRADWGKVASNDYHSRPYHPEKRGHTASIEVASPVTT